VFACRLLPGSGQPVRRWRHAAWLSGFVLLPETAPARRGHVAKRQSTSPHRVRKKSAKRPKMATFTHPWSTT